MADGRPLRERIISIDAVRGIAMILMAIDHVRVYSGVPAGGPTPGVFFTRWITHFVAPTFVFLAGTSAYLYGRAVGSRGALAKFLFTRGLWLIVLELTVIRLCWTFNVDFAHYMLAGVIWVIGLSMIVLSAAVYLPHSAVAAIGVALIALHNLTDFFPLGDQQPSPLLQILYFGGNIGPLFILYVLIPWVGVMMAGYAFGPVMERPAVERRRFCLRLGAALTVLFVVLRWLDVYGDPRHWRNAPSLLRFLGTTKYPASLLFLLMTLGPMFLLIALAEKGPGSRTAGVLATFGRVPMFYYLLHIPLIHAAACVVSLIREGRIDPWLFGNLPVDPPPVPPGYTWSLLLLYAVFAICVAALYFPSRWYAHVRPRHPWLRYL